MYRAAIENLKKWKNKKSRKPLVIEGARQVGKTWLMKEFGRQEYEKTVYINFDADKRAGDLFSENLNPDRIIKMLEIYSGSKIDSDNTLIIFDEIQETPRALSALKYFCEDAPQYHIVFAQRYFVSCRQGGICQAVSSFFQRISYGGRQRAVCAADKG